MRISFDQAKNDRTVLERQLPFELAAQFDFETALVQADLRHEYGEVRYVALGHLQSRLHVLCFSETADGIRVISLRKANHREVKRYAKNQGLD